MACKNSMFEIFSFTGFLPFQKVNDLKNHRAKLYLRRKGSHTHTIEGIREQRNGHVILNTNYVFF
jgi:hypothetical protein